MPNPMGSDKATTPTLSKTSGPTMNSKWKSSRSKLRESKVSKREKRRMEAIKNENKSGCCKKKKKVPFDDEGNPILSFPS